MTTPTSEETPPASQSPNEISAQKRQGPSTALVLGAILFAFLLFRVPMVLKQAGGQDEQWFTIPGYMIAKEGVPSLPYVVAREPNCVFYAADRALFCLPPAFHYVQAPFFWIFPAGHPVGRLPSLISATLAIVVVYVLGRRLLGDEAAGLWAAGLYSLSRILYFPAIFARPDMLCGLCGLVAIWAMTRAEDDRRLRFMALSGAAVGLGGLTHPFAIVFGMQLAVWCLLVPGTLWQRVQRTALWGACAGLVVALWLPLIIAFPEEFRMQFFNNVLNPAGPGLLSRLIWPWPSLAVQWRLMTEHAGVAQLSLMVLGMLAFVVDSAVRPSRAKLRLLALTLSAIYLHAACQGDHPTKGYWCYTGALVFLCLGLLIADGMRWGATLGRIGVPLRASFIIVLLVVLLTGSGIRLWWSRVANWTSVNHDGPAFAHMLAREVPSEGRFVVGPEYVLELYLSGRDVVLDADPREYYGLPTIDYDYLLIGADSLDKDRATQFQGELIRTFGDPDDPFAYYAELHRRSPEAPPAPWPHDADFEAKVEQALQQSAAQPSEN